MKRTTYLLLMMTVFIILFASACGGSAPVLTREVPTSEEIQPTEAVPGDVGAPTQQPAPVQAFAPACQASTICSAPAVDEMDTEVSKTYCVKKVAYQNILVPPGTKFEVLDKSGDFVCADSGTVVDGRNVITCHGNYLLSYQLKLINSACSSNNLTTGTGHCQEGSGYDAAQNCCAPLADDDTGSVIIKVNIGTCL